jgi:hypothetical protein
MTTIDDERVAAGALPNHAAVFATVGSLEIDKTKGMAFPLGLQALAIGVGNDGDALFIE